MAAFDRLTALDASFLEIEDGSTHMHVAAVLLFDAAPLRREDGSLDFERICAVVEARLHAFPRYRQRLAYIPIERHPVWVDDPDFNIHYHVRHTCLPPPGSVRLLKRLTGRIMSQKLDRGKPLWELWVVDGLEGGRFALIVKVHHCMVDGLSGVDLLAALLRPAPERILETPPAWRPRPVPWPSELLARNLVHRATEPLSLARFALDTAWNPRSALQSYWDGAASIAEVFSVGLRPASPTPLNPARIGPHRRFDWIRFDLDRVKEVKQRLGGTVNDVVLTTVGGAVGRFLRGRGMRGLGRTDFRALVPVSLRREEERGRLGNRVAQLLAQLPIAERDPRRRLRRVVATTRELKHSNQAHGTELIEEISDWTATALLTGIVRLAARVRTYNLVVTNVPGPTSPLYLVDAPLLEIYPVVPLFTNQALGVALFSYHDGLYWGFNSDWDRVPDLHDLVDALALEFQELHKASG